MILNILPSNQPRSLFLKMIILIRLHVAKPHYVCLCVKKNMQGRKNNKNREKVNNSQKSMILRKFLFLVEFEPSASYKNNSYKNKQFILDEFKAISFATLDAILPCYTLIKHIFILSMVQ